MPSADFEHHLRGLDYHRDASTIGPTQLADAAGTRRVDSSTGRDIVGRSDQGSYEGLAIPYFLPGESRILEWRLRRDHPDIEYKDGKPKERGKYLSQPGRKNMIPAGEAEELLLSAEKILESKVPGFRGDALDYKTWQYQREVRLH